MLGVNMGIKDYLIRQAPAHLTLLDPQKTTKELAKELGRIAKEANSSAILIGGSTGLSRENLEQCIRGVRDSYERESYGLPIILFPSSANALSSLADAVFFMSLLNSTNREYIIGEQVKGALKVKKMALEPIPVAYLVVEPGMRVGEVGEVELIKRSEPQVAVKYALCAQYLGMEFVYLEAGSGANEPVPPEMVKAVKKEADIYLIVGGGIRSPSQARELVKAGADFLVTGTLIENSPQELKRLVKSIRQKPFKSL